jgi:hypothetical protein
MGSDAEVFVFDYQNYTKAVVPAFLELFREGKVAHWLQPFIKNRDLRPWLWNRNDLAQLCSILQPDLSWIGPYDLNWTYDEEWEHRWTSSFDASETESELSLKAPEPELVEQVNWLFKIAVSIRCLGASQFVGRSATPTYYSEVLADMGVKDRDPLIQLLAALGKRGFIIGYQFSAGVEGISGWLEPSETATLARILATLPLPRYEVSFTAI